jgi:hypothetical protein
MALLPQGQFHIDNPTVLPVTNWLDVRKYSSIRITGRVLGQNLNLGLYWSNNDGAAKQTEFFDSLAFNDLTYNTYNIPIKTPYLSFAFGGALPVSATRIDISSLFINAGQGSSNSALENTGSGVELVDEQTSLVRTLTSTDGSITITQGPDTVDFSTTDTMITVESVGTGDTLIAATSQYPDFRIKSIIPGLGIATDVTNDTVELIVDVSHSGVGSSILYTAGNSIKSRGITPGTGVGLLLQAEDIILSNTSPDQVVTINSGPGINVSGAYPTFTVENTAVIVNQNYGLLNANYLPSATFNVNTSPVSVLIDPVTTFTGSNYTSPSNGVLTYTGTVNSTALIEADIDVYQNIGASPDYHILEIRKNGVTVLATYNTFYKDTIVKEHVHLKCLATVSPNDTIGIYVRYTGAAGQIDITNYYVYVAYSNIISQTVSTIGQYNASTGYQVTNNLYCQFGSIVQAHPSISMDDPNDRFIVNVSGNYSINYSITLGSGVNQFTFRLYVNGVIVETSPVKSFNNFNGSFLTRFITAGSIVRFQFTNSGANSIMLYGAIYFIT